MASCRLADLNNSLCNKAYMRNIIKGCTFNARSIRNQFNDLEVLTASEDYNIIGITESWLDGEQKIS